MDRSWRPALPPSSQWRPKDRSPALAGAPCDNTCGEVCDYGYELFDGRCGRWLRDLSIFAGGDAFKGPLDHGHNGNFGLNEGLNLAGPLGDPWGCGYQIGANFVQSDFSGTTTVTIDDHNIRAADRHQYFLTAGIFRRAICGGLQGGVAFDFLRDDYYDQSDLKQLRSETALVLDDVYEIGYYGAYGLGTDRVIDGRLDPTDMFVAFVRRNFENGGDGRIWGGVTGNGDGLLGADLWVPLGRGFALENRINYLVPETGPRRRRRIARVVGIGHSACVVSRPNGHLPTQESVPRALRRGRQLPVYGQSAGQRTIRSNSREPPRIGEEEIDQGQRGGHSCLPRCFFLGCPDFASGDGPDFRVNGNGTVALGTRNSLADHCPQPPSCQRAWETSGGGFSYSRGRTPDIGGPPSFSG